MNVQNPPQNPTKMAKKIKIKLKGKKRLMFETLIRTLGHITKSAEITNIDRTTHYDWIEKDPEYKAYIDTIGDYQVDFYEAALHGLIKEKNPTSIIFALKCKGKKRGWVERQEIDLVNEKPINIVINKQYEESKK